MTGQTETNKPACLAALANGNAGSEISGRSITNKVCPHGAAVAMGLLTSVDRWGLARLPIFAVPPSASAV